MKASTSEQLTMAQKFANSISDFPRVILEYTQDSLQLILPQHNMAAYLSQTMDGIQTNTLYLVVKHIDKKIERLSCEIRMLIGKFTQRIYRS